MKQQITITKNNKVLFDGKVANMPIKTEYIVKKSVELFDDEDPCIIHQSYVVKEYVDVLLNILKNNNKTIEVKDFLVELDYIDYTELGKLTISLKG